MGATVQAYLPGSLRTLALSLNLGSVLLLGGAAGKAAAGVYSRRCKHDEAAARAAADHAAPSSMSSPSSSLDHHDHAVASSSGSSSAAAAAASPQLLVRMRRPSRWFRGQPLFGGSTARGFASMPCPVSDDEDAFEFDEEDLVDLRWQYLWQQQQQACLAAQNAAAVAAQLAAPARGSSALPPAAPATPPQPHPQPAVLQPQQLHLHAAQQQQQHASLARDLRAPPPPLLPWERLGVEEQQRRLAQYSAEHQLYCKRTMHSMTLPFLLEAYSLAVPPPEGAGVEVRPAPARQMGRPRKEAGEVRGSKGGREKDWAGGAPSVTISKTLRKVFSSETHPELQHAMAKLDTCFTVAGGWKAGHGPAQLRKDSSWRAPGPTHAGRMAAFLLEEAGASEVDVLGAIMAAPWLLGMDLEAHARPTLDLLRRYGFGGEQQGGEVAQQQQSTPVGRLLTARPVLMLLPKEEHLQPLLQYMADLGFTPSQQERLLRDNSVLCGPDGPQRLRLVVSFLAGKGLSREEVVHVVNQVPRVLQYTPDSLQLKWQYMEQALGGSSKDIAACPYYLETSLYNVLGPRVAVAQAQGVPILLPSRVEGEGQRRGGLKRAAKAGGLNEREAGGISLWKLLRDNSSKLAAKLGTSTEEFQRHVHHWQQHEWQQWQRQQPRELEHYMNLAACTVEAHLASHQRCCSY